MTSSLAGAESLSVPSPAADGSSSDAGRKSPARPDTGLSPQALAPGTSSPSPPKDGDGSEAVPANRNGDGATETAATQDESEAETVRLSDHGGDADGKTSKRVVKPEKVDGGKMSDIPSRRDSRDAPASPNGVKPKREADEKDENQRQGKTTQAKLENGVIHGNGSPSSPSSPRGSRAPSRQETEGSPRGSAASPHGKDSPGQDRGHSGAPSRKRKNRDEHHFEKLEPPRQRQKSVASVKESAIHSSRNQPESPVTSSSRPHKRSDSIQSNAPPRKRRDVVPPPLSLDRKSWNSDSSSEGSSSPRPTTAPRLQSRVKRSSHRSLASPVRAMAPRKNVDKFGATRLARECEKGDVDLVEEAYEAAREELNQEDYAGISPLQKASLQGHTDAVKFLISKGCRTDCEAKNGDTPLIDAVENGHLDVVKLLLDKGRVNPHHQNRKGQRAVDVINDDEEHADEIEIELKKAMRRENNEEEKDRTPRQPGQSSNLLYNEYNTETLRDKAAEGDMGAVAELITSNIKPNNACGVAAARGGHDEILSIFLGVGLKSDPDPSKHNDTPMTVAIGRGHLKVIEMLLDQDGFNPTRRDRRGRTYWELSEELQGPKWQQERDMLKARYDEYRRRYQSDKHSQRSPGTMKKRQGTNSPSAVRGRVARPSSPPPHRTRRASSPSSPEIKKSRRRPSPPSHTPSHASKRSSLPDQKSQSVLADRDRADRFKAGAPRTKDPSSQRELVRRRRVVDEDSSSDENVNVKSSPPAKRIKSIGKPRDVDERRDEQRKGSVSKHVKAKDERATSSPHESARKGTPDADRESRQAELRAKRAAAEARKAEMEAKQADAERQQRHEEEQRRRKVEEEKRAAEEKRQADERRRAEEQRQADEKRRLEAERKAEEERKRRAAEEDERRRREEEERTRREAEEREREREKERGRERERQRKEAEETRKRKEAEEERKRKEAEAAAAAEAARRRAEEEAAAAAAARQLAAEQAAAARERRVALLRSLPTQVRLAVELGPKRPLVFEPVGRRRRIGIQAAFMPIHTVAFREIDPTPASDTAPRSRGALPPPDSGPSTESTNAPAGLLDAAQVFRARPPHAQPWMLSLQAVGVLGLSEPDGGAADWAFPAWERLPVTAAQLERWSLPYDAETLAFEFAAAYEPAPLAPMTVAGWRQSGWDETRCRTRGLMDHLRRAEEARTQLREMLPLLRWVRYADFLTAVAERPDLAGLRVWRTGCSHAVDWPDA